MKLYSYNEADYGKKENFKTLIKHILPQKYTYSPMKKNDVFLKIKYPDFKDLTHT